MVDRQSRRSWGGGGMETGRYSMAKTSVWWDMEQYPIPAACDPYLIAGNIYRTLAMWGYDGEATINAFGDTRKIPYRVQLALARTGITLNDAGFISARMTTSTIKCQIYRWARNNRPPANYLIISDEFNDYLGTFHDLSVGGYNALNEPLAEKDRLLIGILDGVRPSSNINSGNQKVCGKRGRPTSNVSSGNQKACGKRRMFSATN